MLYDFSVRVEVSLNPPSPTHRPLSLFGKISQDSRSSPTSKPRTPTSIHTIANPRPEPFTMSLAASRQVLRHSRFAVRRAGIRNASSTSEAAGAAKEKASEASSKASEGLSRVTSSASATASKVGDAASNAMSKVGGRTGRLIGSVQGEYAPLGPLHR